MNLLRNETANPQTKHNLWKKFQNNNDVIDRWNETLWPICHIANIYIRPQMESSTQQQLLQFWFLHSAISKLPKSLWREQSHLSDQKVRPWFSVVSQGSATFFWWTVLRDVFWPWLVLTAIMSTLKQVCYGADTWFQYSPSSSISLEIKKQILSKSILESWILHFLVFQLLFLPCSSVCLRACVCTRLRAWMCVCVSVQHWWTQHNVEWCCFGSWDSRAEPAGQR